MNSQEFLGLKEILEYLTTEDLLSVMGTTTKHLVKAETRDEAIKVIMDYSPRASTILRRKKITRTILFDYLFKHNVTVPPTAEKPAFIAACLKFWRSTDLDQGSSLNDIEEELPKCPPAPCAPEPVSTVEMGVEPVVNNSKISQLGFQFAKWFFEVLNSQNDFGPQHFWPDCKLWLHSKVSGMKEEDFCIMGSNNVASHLSNYVTAKRYFFKPNSSGNGVMSVQEQHGLVKVSISGVIHQLSNCIGLFDFAFGLVCDPFFNDNWKIKHVTLVIQVNNNSGSTINHYPQQIPSLCQ